LEQGDVDVKELATVGAPLATTAITTHKDRGIRITAACCAADVLRLCAPDAPYTDESLTVPLLVTRS